MLKDIQNIRGREVLDSRGNPTVEVEVTLRHGIKGRAMVPSGASTGIYEALELRDGDKERYGGKGVEKAIKHVNGKIEKALQGMDVTCQADIDETMLELDGTDFKKNLGANAMLGVSLACASAAANIFQMPVYRYIGGIAGTLLPVPMMNILNGGAHADNGIDVQEFMIMPVSACCFKEALRMGTEVYHSLKKVLESRGLSTAVGDEGGFAPNIDTVEEVLDLLVEAVQRAGYECGKDICFAMDAAASEWKSPEGKGVYVLPKSGRRYKTDELIDMYKQMSEKYPIVSIEDPLDEED